MDTPHNWHLLDKTSLNSDMTVSHPSSLPGTERMQNIGATPVIHIKLVEVPKQAKRLPSDSMDFGHTHTHLYHFVSYPSGIYRAEAVWQKLKSRALQKTRGETLEEPPQVVQRLCGPLEGRASGSHVTAPVHKENADAKVYDVVVCGGTLGILVARRGGPN